MDGGEGKIAERERESKEVAGVASPCVVDLDHGVPLFGPLLYNNKA